MEWQLIGDDRWVFGVKVRGVVRNRLAEVYHDPEREQPWVWLAKDPDGRIRWRGLARNLSEALERAEENLGWCVSESDNSTRIDFKEPSSDLGV